MVRKIDTDSKLHTKLPHVYVFPVPTTQQEKQPLDKRNLPQESKTCINGNSSQGNRLIMLHTPILLRGLRPRDKKILNFVITLQATGHFSLQRLYWLKKVRWLFIRVRVDIHVLYKYSQKQVDVRVYGTLYNAMFITSTSVTFFASRQAEMYEQRTR